MGEETVILTMLGLDDQQKILITKTQRYQAYNNDAPKTYFDRKGQTGRHISFDDITSQIFILFLSWIKIESNKSKLHKASVAFQRTSRQLNYSNVHCSSPHAELCGPSEQFCGPFGVRTRRFQLNLHRSGSGQGRGCTLVKSISLLLV